MNVEIADLKGKKVLFIANFYPPVESTNVPGAMRTIKFLRNLKNLDAHVLTTPPQIPEDRSALKHLSLPVNGETIHRIDSWDIFKILLALRAKLKKVLKPGTGSQEASSSDSAPQQVFKTNPDPGADQSISKAQALKDFIYNLCYFPDQAGPWIFPAYFAGKKIVKQQNIDAIFATGSPWSGLITGYMISKATGVPLIIDFRDPWMNNPFHQSKGAFLDNWSKKLERKVVAHASAISLNTPPLQDDFVDRYPSEQDKFFVMPNGFDLNDFDEILASEKPEQSDTITLCHAGFLYGVRDPSVLLDAIQVANERLQDSGKSIVFKQIGDIQLGYDINERYGEMISKGDLIIEASKPYKDALKSLARANWVVNVQPATKSQVPSKLYDYLALRRPILNITPKDGALGQIVRNNDIGLLFGFDEKDELVEALLDISSKHESNSEFPGYEARELFDCRKIAKDLASTIEKVAQ